MKMCAMKKIAMFGLSLCSVATLAAGVGLLSATTAKAEMTGPISSFILEGGSVRIAQNQQYNGMRFVAEMSADDFSTYITGGKLMESGAILCDASKLDEAKVLTESTVGGVKIQTTEIWANNKAGVFMYEIPRTEEALCSEVAVVMYYKVENDANVYYSETIVRSAAGIAYSAYTDRSDAYTEEKYKHLTTDGDYSPYDGDQLETITDYLPQLTVAYQADGKTVASASVRYGDKVDAASAPIAPEKAGYEFIGWTLNGEAYDFNAQVLKSVALEAVYAEKEYVYGKGFSVVSETQNSTASEVKVTEGENAGKWYKQLTKEETAEGGGVLTVSATAEAGLEANTQYIVSLGVEVDGAWPGFYSENDDILAYGDQFYRTSNTPEWVFHVTTDENGAFTRLWKNIYWKGGTFVKFTNLTVLKSAYDKGLEVYVFNKGDESVINDTLEKLADGTGIYKINRTYNGNKTIQRTLYINGKGLEANKKYQITATIDTDGHYCQIADAWTVKAGGSNKLQFTVTTDENGAFTQWYSTNFFSGTYVKFSDIEIGEIKPLAYGDGITITPTHGVATIGEEILTEGDNAGKKIVVMNKTHTEGTAGKLTVSATSKADLKANTVYVVTMEIEVDRTDGNASGNGYYDQGNAWLAKPNAPTCKFEITTDANGEFTKTFNTWWVGASSTVKFKAITIVEKAS